MMVGLLVGLFLGAFVTNVAIAVLPHEPLVIWYGQQIGVPLTALIATAGTLVACWVDRLLFMDWIAKRSLSIRGGVLGRMIDGFDRAPFFILAVSGLTPFPFWPFKLLAFANRYSTSKYLAAIALGRLPRYALLAWLGMALPFPSWLLPAACVLMTIWIAFSHYRERKEKKWTPKTPPSESRGASPTPGRSETCPESLELSPDGSRPTI